MLHARHVGLTRRIVWSPNHPRGDRVVGRLVDQDEAAGGAVIGIAIGEHRLRERQRHAADVVASRASRARARASASRRSTGRRCDRSARAPRGSCAGAGTCGAGRAAHRRASRAWPSTTARDCGRAGCPHEHVAARDVELVVELQRYGRMQSAPSGGEPSKVRISRTRVASPDGSADDAVADGDCAGFDAAEVAARPTVRRVARRTGPESGTARRPRRRGPRPFPGSAAAWDRRTSRGGRRDRRPCRRRAPTSARNARPRCRMRSAKAQEIRDDRARTPPRGNPTRSILFTATTRCGMPTRCARWRAGASASTTPWRASTSRTASCAVEAAVTMLRVYCSWPGASAMMNLRSAVAK